MALWAFMDESGTHDARGNAAGADVVGISGYLGSVQNWERWESEWRQCLASENITTFHMVDCQWRRGEFKGWTEKRRDKFLDRLLKIIDHHDLWGIGGLIDLQDYESMPRWFKKELGHPYYFCFRMCINELLRKRTLFASDKIHFVFDQQHTFSGEAVRIFNTIKGLPFSDLLGDIAFKSKKELPQLQAADLVAWQLRAEISRFLHKPNLKIREAMKTLRSQHKLLVMYHNKSSLNEFKENWGDRIIERAVRVSRQTHHN